MTKDKYQELYEKIQYMFACARDNGEITYNQETLLLTYLEDIKEEIDKE